MKVTLKHREFYIYKKVSLKSKIWENTRQIKINIHDLINCQIKVARKSITNSWKQTFYLQLARAKTPKSCFVQKWINHYSEPSEMRENEHKIAFLKKILRRFNI